MLSTIPIDHDALDGGTYEINQNDGTVEIEWETLDFEDADDDGTPDFKTMAIRVFSQGELKMQSYYRRIIN
jgi:predicted secreted protein